MKEKNIEKNKKRTVAKPSAQRAEEAKRTQRKKGAPGQKAGRTPTLREGKEDAGTDRGVQKKAPIQKPRGEERPPKERRERPAKGGKRGKEKISAVGSLQTPAKTASLNTQKKSGRGEKLRVFALGGLGEIGKNMTVLEYGRDMVVIDCGMGFPDEDMPGVDLVIPDVSYLEKNADRVRGIFITHGHEDHIGAVPYILSKLHVPVYGTRLSLGIIEGKLEEHKLPFTPSLYTVEAGDVIGAGAFRVEFIHVNHSIADACALAIHTPAGVVFHSGDFKLDVSPIDGRMMDVCRIGQIGKEGVTLLLLESTNAERAGFTPSEKTVGSSLERIFMQYEDRRLIIATFSSNVHRVQQIMNASLRHKRKVAILGRSMVNIVGAAKKLGYMEFPEELLVDVSEIKKYRQNEITLITTGSQGEPMSALYRIAFGEHDRVKLDPSDVVVLSSGTIPGNEKLVGKIVNALVGSGVKIVSDAVEEVHVSGHACREELKLMIALLSPKYFMPVHGEARHLYANAENARFMGIKEENIFVSAELGKVLEIGPGGAGFAGTVPAGKVLVDGSGVGDIGSVVLRERKLLSEDGLVVVVATVDLREGYIISGPDLLCRGFVYVKESEELINEARLAVGDALDLALSRRIRDPMELKNIIRDTLGKLMFQKTKRKPMILPVLMDI